MSQKEFAPISSLILTHRPQSAESNQSGELERQTPVGAIVFDGNKQVALVCATSQGNIRCQYHSSQEVNISQIPVSHPRLLNLNDCQTVIVVHAGLGAISAQAYPTIRQRKPVISIRLWYTNPETGQEQDYSMDEQKVIRVLRCHEGGLAVFHGEGYPDEHALVIKSVNAETQALVAFIRPELPTLPLGDYSLTLSSVTGVAEFFGRVNNVFKNHPAITPDVLALLTELDSINEKLPPNKKETPARLHVLKSQIMACAIMSVQDRNSAEDLDKIRKDLVLQGSGSLGKLVRIFSGSKRVDINKLSEVIDKTVRAMTIGTSEYQQQRVLSTPQFEKKLEERKSKLMLRTIKAILLHEQVHHALQGEFGLRFGGEFVLETMKEYVKLVVNFIKDASTEDDYLDAEQLVNELMKTQYREMLIYCSFSTESITPYTPDLFVSNLYYNRAKNSKPIELRVLLEHFSDHIARHRAQFVFGKKNVL